MQNKTSELSTEFYSRACEVKFSAPLDSWLFTTESVVTIGRDKGCDITIADPRISRQHAIIQWKENGYSIEDLRSKNGTFVNGISAGKSQPLKHGDEIQIGFCLKFRFCQYENHIQIHISYLLESAHLLEPIERGL